MSEPDVTSDLGREPDKPLHLDFAASRPQVGAGEDPLHLGERPRRGLAGTTYGGFTEGPAAPPRRRAGSRRGLLTVGLAAVLGLGVAAALVGYAALERGAPSGGPVPAAPAPAPQVEARPARPVAEAVPPPSPSPSPALAEAPPPEPQPRVAERPRETRRPSRPARTAAARAADEAATARANMQALYAPDSTLSAQAAQQ